jgi:SAM-dependent methyltransferase
MTERGKAGYAGTGPGEFTPDGCAVDLYARLPVGNEPQVIAAAAPPPASLLELGCGAGRVTRSLVALGYDVTAVDESAAMLARVRGARTVHRRIEELDLPGTFDVVVLASFLVHGRTAPELLRTCRRHVAPGGRVLVQREGPGWHEEVPRERPAGDGVARVVADEDAGDGYRAVHVEYEFPDAFWTQTFRSRPLTVEQFEGLMGDAGLSVDRYLTPHGDWVAASPI